MISGWSWKLSCGSRGLHCIKLINFIDLMWESYNNQCKNILQPFHNLFCNICASDQWSNVVPVTSKTPLGLRDDFSPLLNPIQIWLLECDISSSSLHILSICSEKIQMDHYLSYRNQKEGYLAVYCRVLITFFVQLMIIINMIILENMRHKRKKRRRKIFLRFLRENTYLLWVKSIFPWESIFYQGQDQDGLD